MEDKQPNNVMCDILSRLPVKIIIRCKCVCKKWRDHVSDPYFVNLHLSRSREALMIFNYYKPFRPGNLMWVELGNKALVQVKRLALTQEMCFGMLFYAKSGGLSEWFDMLRLPPQGVLHIQSCVGRIHVRPFTPTRFKALSFGSRVSRAGEYKFIHISIRKISLDSDKLYAIEIKVYTLGTGKWRILGQTPFRFKSIKGEVDNGVFVNTHVYWIIHDQIYDFDLNAETFELFPSPRGIAEHQ